MIRSLKNKEGSCTTSSRVGCEGQLEERGASWSLWKVDGFRSLQGPVRGVETMSSEGMAGVALQNKCPEAVTKSLTSLEEEYKVC